MASPTPFRVRKPKIAAKRPIKRSENDIESLGPSIPQKRKRLDIESSPVTALRGTPHCGLGRAYTVTENTRWARDDVEYILVEVLRLAFFFFLFFSVLEF